MHFLKFKQINLKTTSCYRKWRHQLVRKNICNVGHDVIWKCVVCITNAHHRNVSYSCQVKKYVDWG